jgi:cholesterol transport system auxiliary component
MPRRAIVASQSFDHRVTAAADSMPEIIAAFDEAAGKVLRRLVAWTLIEGDRADRAMRRTS